jgi:hypothetical protein
LFASNKRNDAGWTAGSAEDTQPSTRDQEQFDRVRGENKVWSRARQENLGLVVMQAGYAGVTEEPLPDSLPREMPMLE